MLMQSAIYEVAGKTAAAGACAAVQGCIEVPVQTYEVASRKQLQCMRSRPRVHGNANTSKVERGCWQRKLQVVAYHQHHDEHCRTFSHCRRLEVEELVQVVLCLEDRLWFCTLDGHWQMLYTNRPARFSAYLI